MTSPELYNGPTTANPKVRAFLASLPPSIRQEFMRGLPVQGQPYVEGDPRAYGEPQGLPLAPGLGSWATNSPEPPRGIGGLGIGSGWAPNAQPFDPGIDDGLGFTGRPRSTPTPTATTNSKRGQMASFGQPPTPPAPPPGDPSDATLEAIINAMAQQGNQPQGNPMSGMGDYLQQLQGFMSGVYAPQYGQIDAARNRTQQQYNMSDKVVEGLYAKLQADIQGQAAAKQAQAAAITPDNDLPARIAAAYQKSQDYLTQGMAANGTQAAAPDVLAPLAQQGAFQSGQALTQNQANADYGRNQGTNQANWLQNVSNAAGTQGAVSRENLIRDLASAFAGLDSQRAALASKEASDSLSWAEKLANMSREDYRFNQQQQGQGLENLKSLYELQAEKEGNAWNRAYQQSQLDLERQRIGLAGQGEAKLTDPTALKVSMVQSGIPQPIAEDAVRVAIEASAGGNKGSGNPVMTDIPSFVQHVVLTMQQRYPGNPTAQEAATTAALAYAEKMNFKTTNSF